VQKIFVLFCVKFYNLRGEPSRKVLIRTRPKFRSYWQRQKILLAACSDEHYLYIILVSFKNFNPNPSNIRTRRLWNNKFEIVCLNLYNTSLIKCVKHSVFVDSAKIFARSKKHRFGCIVVALQFSLHHQTPTFTV
jgi:hypothetical protein